MQGTVGPTQIMVPYTTFAYSSAHSHSPLSFSAFMPASGCTQYNNREDWISLL